MSDDIDRKPEVAICDGEFGELLNVNVPDLSISFYGIDAKIVFEGRQSMPIEEARKTLIKLANRILSGPLF